MAVKQQYEAPALTVIGSFETITQAWTNGPHNDIAYPATLHLTNDYS
jgi:hypothetical protein